MLHLWISILDALRVAPSDWIWVHEIIEDGRTMLIARGLTVESAQRNLQGEEWNCITSSNGICKVCISSKIHSHVDIPDDIQTLINEHLGINTPSTENI